MQYITATIRPRAHPQFHARRGPIADWEKRAARERCCRRNCLADNQVEESSRAEGAPCS